MPFISIFTPSPDKRYMILNDYATTTIRFSIPLYVLVLLFRCSFRILVMLRGTVVCKYGVCIFILSVIYESGRWIFQRQRVACVWEGREKSEEKLCSAENQVRLSFLSIRDECDRPMSRLLFRFVVEP